MLYLSELQEELDELDSQFEDAEQPGNPSMGGDEYERRAVLRDFIAEVSDYSEDDMLIPEDEFEDYTRQFAEDIGAIDSDARWPATCIDWEQAARELQMDYTGFMLDGQTYYAR